MNGKRILLCVSGGIAAYKAAGLTSTLVQQGALVDVMMTAEAERFVGALTFSSLTARPVYTSLWDMPERIPHVRLVREAEMAVVVPATANIIAKLAHGLADDIVTTALLAARIPIVVAPAMNAAMYENPATVANMETLREHGMEIVEPESGFLAERERGIGRLASEERILETMYAILAGREKSLAGKRIVITAGPTREAFDPIRFISNASTGSQGIAIAHEAARRGADVTLILGPTLLPIPEGIRTERVTTAREMYDATIRLRAHADIVIATAAVADWRPAESSAEKLKKSDEDLRVRLVRNPDILAALGQSKSPKSFLVGFAAETSNHETHARKKIKEKHLDAIVVNDVRDEHGFGTGTTTLTLLHGRNGRVELGTATKPVLAVKLWNALEEIFVGHPDSIDSAQDKRSIKGTKSKELS